MPFTLRNVPNNVTNDLYLHDIKPVRTVQISYVHEVLCMIERRKNVHYGHL